MVQLEVHGRVQVNVRDVQELCVEDAGAAGRSHAEGVGGAGRGQIQPLHGLPRGLAEAHAGHAVAVRGQLGVDWGQRSGRVHGLPVGQQFVLVGGVGVVMRVGVVVVMVVVVVVVVMVVVMVVVVAVGTAVSVSVPRVVLRPFLRGHFEQGGLATQEGLQVSVGHVAGREAVGRRVFVVSVEPWESQGRAAWGHRKVRHNFGYSSLPLFSDVSGQLLKRKRTSEVSDRRV